MTTSRNNTIMSWMAYTDFLSRLRIAAGILLPLNTRTLLLYPGGRDCIGAAGVDAYATSPWNLGPGKNGLGFQRTSSVDTIAALCLQYPQEAYRVLERHSPEWKSRYW